MLIILGVYLGSIITVVSNSSIVSLTGLALNNISIYAKIINFNYRSIMNYIIVSSVTFILITYSYCTDLFIGVGVLAIGIKLSIFPFISWSRPIYRNLTIQISLWLILVTKVLYCILLSNLLYYTSTIMPMLMINLLFGGLAAISVYDSITLILISGSIQLVYIVIPLILDPVISELYIVLYMLISGLLALVIILKLSPGISALIIYIVLYSLSGIPPLLGFYTKLIVISTWIGNFSLLIVLLVIISSIFISYLYFRIPFKLFTIILEASTQLPNIIPFTLAIILAIPLLITDIIPICLG